MFTQLPKKKQLLLLLCFINATLVLSFCHDRKLQILFMYLYVCIQVINQTKLEMGGIL